jgi:hypothetical protein
MLSVVCITASSRPSPRGEGHLFTAHATLKFTICFDCMNDAQLYSLLMCKN